MAYTHASRTLPDGGTQAGPEFGDSTLANDRAAIDAIIMGHVPGWTLSVSGGTAEQPAQMLWTQGANILRATITWGTVGGEAGQIKQIVWAMSSNGGADYTTSPGGAIDTMINAFDASGFMTSSSGGGGFVMWLSYLLGRFKTLWNAVSAHASATGNTVHGLGTMSTQNKTAVDVDGGTIDDVALKYTHARGKALALNGGSISGAVAIDWAAADTYYGTVTGNTTFSWASLPPSGYAGSVTLELTDPGAFTVTWPAGVKWPSGSAPVRTVSGVDLYEFWTRDGATIRGAQAQKASA